MGERGREMDPSRPSVLTRSFSAARDAAYGRLRRRAARGCREALDHATVLGALRRLDDSSPSFDHLRFDEFDLHAALEDYLGRDIGYDVIPDHRSALVHRVVRREAIHGELVYAPSTGALRVELAATLHPADRKAAHYEELAHLMAAHPVPYRMPGTPPEHRSFWHPPRLLCDRRPPFDLGLCGVDPDTRREMIAWCEADADAWVEHLRAISALGRDVYLREERIIGL